MHSWRFNNVQLENASPEDKADWVCALDYTLEIIRHLSRIPPFREELCLNRGGFWSCGPGSPTDRILDMVLEVDHFDALKWAVAWNSVRWTRKALAIQRGDITDLDVKEALIHLVS